MVEKVEQRARMGAQLAGRGFAAQRDLAASSGLTLPKATQIMTDRHNYAHGLGVIKRQYLEYGEHESFFGNMDPITQMEGKDLISHYEGMTP